VTAADPAFLGPGNPRPSPVLPAAAQALRRLRHGVRDLGDGNDDAGPRLRFLTIVFAAAFGVLALGATRAALLGGPAPPRAAPPPTRMARADLVDRNGEVLATDVIRYGLYVRPAEIADRSAAAAVLGAILPQVKTQQIAGALEGHAAAIAVTAAGPAAFDPVAAIIDAARGRRRGAARAADPDREFFVAGDLTPEVKDRLHDLALPGLDFQEEAGRLYPLGETAAHLIGYARTDGRALAGAEGAFDEDIRRAGSRPVALSVDLRVQAALQEEVESAARTFNVKGAAGLVVNVRTGEILALESYPIFNPNTVSTLRSKEDRDRLINHAAGSVYEPGSVFKIFTLAMALDSGIAGLDTPVDVHSPLVLPGQTIHDYDKADRNLGHMPLWEVFTHSSNIGAAQLSLKAGPERVERYFRAFGLFDRAPSAMAESARPLAPETPLTRNTLATVGFGHAISVSPLALATGMSAILNGGLYRPLTLVRRDPGPAPPAVRQVIRPATSQQMLGLMRLNATQGTGRAADALAPGYRVGGKTGTATKLKNGHYNGANLNLASFAAIFPTDGPLEADRYLVLIMLDEPHGAAATHGLTTGGVISAPVAGRVIARIAPLLGVRRDPVQAPRAPAALDPVVLSGGER
jgi:cell division protein FtsI (penicillin-binding protein 3)